jgi:hypothetical protein
MNIYRRVRLWPQPIAMAAAMCVCHAVAWAPLQVGGGRLSALCLLIAVPKSLTHVYTHKTHKTHTTQHTHTHTTRARAHTRKNMHTCARTRKNIHTCARALSLSISHTHTHTHTHTSSQSTWVVRMRPCPDESSPCVCMHSRARRCSAVPLGQRACLPPGVFSAAMLALALRWRGTPRDTLHVPRVVSSLLSRYA